MGRRTFWLFSLTLVLISGALAVHAHTANSAVAFALTCFIVCVGAIRQKHL